MLNHLIILFVFSKKARNEIKISSSLLTDYSILAVLDIALMIIYYFPKWMGMKFFIRNIIKVKRIAFLFLQFVKLVPVLVGEGLVYLSKGKWGIVLAVQSVWICKGRLYLDYS